MNMALAPGTLGYMAGTLMSPVFDGWERRADLVLHLATSAAAAPIPAIRIGAQPYGIIAVDRVLADVLAGATSSRDASARIARADRQSAPAAPARCPGATGGQLARPASARCRTSAAAPTRTRPCSTSSGLHPNSAEFHIRHGKTSTSSRRAAGSPLPRPAAPSEPPATAAPGRRCDCCGDLGYAGARARPPRPVLPAGADPAERAARSRPCRSRRPTAAGRCHDRRPQLPGVAGRRGPQPRSTCCAGRRASPATRRRRRLLYIMLQFALTRGYQDAGDRLRVESGLFDAPRLLRALRREPTSVHVVADAARRATAPGGASTSRTQRLTGQRRPDHRRPPRRACCPRGPATPSTSPSRSAPSSC